VAVRKGLSSCKGGKKGKKGLHWSDGLRIGDNKGSSIRKQRDQRKKIEAALIGGLKKTDRKGDE